MPEKVPLATPFRNAYSLKGEVCLVTGGGTGLGLGMARAFIASGARVVLVGRRELVLAAAVNELDGATYEVHDITHNDKSDELLARVANRVGPVSVVVNNAGIHQKKPFEEISDDEFLSVLNVHLLGAASVTRASIPYMTKTRHGVVLFITSMAALFGMPKVAAYSAAKSACMGLVRSLACELAPKNIRVNAITPGWIDTPMLHRALDGDSERKKRILQRTPMERFGDPEDVGWAAVYLCSPSAKFITGAILPVDGGASIGF